MNRAGAATIGAYPSPNFGPRKSGAVVDMIVIHYTAMPETDKVLKWLCTPENEVSAHYVISPLGEAWQLVAEDMRAWHAGAARWGEVSDVNSRSIGIELVNSGATPFAEPQMAALERLLAPMIDRWKVPLHRVVGHSCVAPGRKIDPGRRFDWPRLALQGLAISSAPVTAASGPERAAEAALRAVAIGPEGADQAAMAGELAALGYTAEVPFDVLLGAFRLRHRPWATGPLAPADWAMAQGLAARYPVDGPPALA